MQASAIVVSSAKVDPSNHVVLNVPAAKIQALLLSEHAAETGL